MTDADIAKISMSDIVFYRERKAAADMAKMSVSVVAFYKERKVTEADMVWIQNLLILI